MDSHEEVFRKWHLFSKEDILKSLEMLIEYEKTEQDDYSEQIRRNRVKLCEQFKRLVSMVKLPDFKYDWWFYEYQFPEVEDGEMSSMSSHEERTLLTVESDYLSIEEYAALMEVQSETVENWIQKGKLRHARRMESEWKIPDTQERPKRKFVDVTYIVKFGEEIDSQEFPMLETAETISIRRDENKKNSYMYSMF